MTSPYKLDYRSRLRLHDRAYRAQQKDHTDVCGALVVNDSHDLELWFMRNISGQPASWEIDINELARLRKKAVTQGKRIAGTFHSHPVGYAIPGLRDRRTARVNSLMLVYDVCARSAQLWRFVKSGKRKICKQVPLVLLTKNTRRSFYSPLSSPARSLHSRLMKLNGPKTSFHGSFQVG